MVAARRLPASLPRYADGVRAIVITPGTAGSARVEEVPEPASGAGLVLVECLEVGVCGSDKLLVAGKEGAPPEGSDRLVLGHENLGRVLEAPPATPFSPGDLVMARVRHRDPVPCRQCAAGRQDHCENGRATERGITGRDGFMSDRWSDHPENLTLLDPDLERVGVLMEPTTVVEKALRRAELVRREVDAPLRRAVVTGAGPIGLLGALLLRLRGAEVTVVDVVGEDTPRARVATDAGCEYVRGDVEPLPELVERVGRPDVLLEATGVPSLVLDAMRLIAPDGVVALAGVTAGDRTAEARSDAINDALVKGNGTVLGSVNAAMRDHAAAAESLRRASQRWPGLLESMITRRLPPERLDEALDPDPRSDVKITVAFAVAADTGSGSTG